MFQILSPSALVLWATAKKLISSFTTCIIQDLKDTICNPTLKKTTSKIQEFLSDKAEMFNLLIPGSKRRNL